MKKTITNKTRNLGFGYNEGIFAGEDYPSLPNKPDFVGTIKQIREQIYNSKDFQFLKSSGTYYNWCFFYGDERITKVYPDGDFNLIWEFLNDGIKVEVITEKVEK